MRSLKKKAEEEEEEEEDTGKRWLQIQMPWPVIVLGTWESHEFLGWGYAYSFSPTIAVSCALAHFRVFSAPEP